jgi:superfamily I DNA/RNA helicase
MTETAIEKALNRDVGWLYEMIKKQRKDGLEYPINVFKQNGREAIEDNPRIIIGTIHSVKGAEASTVIVFPDISWQADEELRRSTEAKESIYRVFYVAMTRAREELILTNPAVKNVTSEPRFFVDL